MQHHLLLVLTEDFQRILYVNDIVIRDASNVELLVPGLAVLAVVMHMKLASIYELVY